MATARQRVVMKKSAPQNVAKTKGKGPEKDSDATKGQMANLIRDPDIPPLKNHQQKKKMTEANDSPREDRGEGTKTPEPARKREKNSEQLLPPTFPLLILGGSPVRFL